LRRGGPLATERLGVLSHMLRDLLAENSGKGRSDGGRRRGGGNNWGEPAVLDDGGQGGHARPVALDEQLAELRARRAQAI